MISNRKAVAELKAKYPHHVLMRDWKRRDRKYKDFLITQQSDASWVEEYDTRTFGFTDPERAFTFSQNFNGELL